MLRARADGIGKVADEAGFTLLEVLAAVAIAGFVLSAVGSLVAVTFAGIRSTGDRVALAAVGRTLLDTLPQGADLKPGTRVGSSGPIRWRIDVTPQAGPFVARKQGDDAGPSTLWRSASIAIAARLPSGRSVRLETSGLLRVAP